MDGDGPMHSKDCLIGQLSSRARQGASPATKSRSYCNEHRRFEVVAHIYCCPRIVITAGKIPPSEMAESFADRVVSHPLTHPRPPSPYYTGQFEFDRSGLVQPRHFVREGYLSSADTYAESLTENGGLSVDFTAPCKAIFTGCKPVFL
ncbi:hypothetical protein PGT21_034741 [Puccinia graminis f. sp. tritici]|uniref:Uncharacterized protein n=1 Tax=Puccinia graminis f. sp. tritici TaxID=56615 RepID=A0A5B0NFY4_PUCGR|nr:hypothetical protein PGT21_034741 [Puccinia graminis f. sp. tritici]